MATARFGLFLRHIRRLAPGPGTGGLPDGQGSQVQILPGVFSQLNARI